MEFEGSRAKTEVDPAVQAEFEQAAAPVMAVMKEYTEGAKHTDRVTYQTPMLEGPGIGLFIDHTYYGSVTPAEDDKFELNLGKNWGGSVIEDASAIATRLQAVIDEGLMKQPEEH